MALTVEYDNSGEYSVLVTCIPAFSSEHESFEQNITWIDGADVLKKLITDKLLITKPKKVIDVNGKKKVLKKEYWLNCTYVKFENALENAVTSLNKNIDIPLFMSWFNIKSKKGNPVRNSRYVHKYKKSKKTKATKKTKI